MFASYNKNNAKGTLVGNWVEEDALRSTTGFSRRKVPTSVMSTGTSNALHNYYSGNLTPVITPVDARATRIELTHPRVLQHSTVANPQFETTLQASTDYGRFSDPVPIEGPRRIRRDSDLRLLAQKLHNADVVAKQTLEEQERIAITSTTTTASCFLAHDTSVWDGVTRVPRGRNGGRVFDPVVQHLTRGEVDSIDQMTLKLMDGAAVTRYSHAIATGVGLDFAASVSDMANPFGRSSAFTNDIHDTTKRHGEATEPGQDQDERIGTSVNQRAALRKLAQLCSDPVSTGQVIDTLTSCTRGNNTSQYIELGEFRSAFASLNHFTEREVIQIFMYFDADNVGAIRSSDILELCSRESAGRPSSTSSTASPHWHCNLRV